MGLGEGVVSKLQGEPVGRAGEFMKQGEWSTHIVCCVPGVGSKIEGLGFRIEVRVRGFLDMLLRLQLIQKQ